MSGKRALVGSYHVAALRSRSRTLGFDEANAYVAAAWAPGLEEGLLLKHRWRVGDLVAWSNRLVIHTATSTAPYRHPDWEVGAPTKKLYEQYSVAVTLLQILLGMRSVYRHPSGPQARY